MDEFEDWRKARWVPAAAFLRDEAAYEGPHCSHAVDLVKKYIELHPGSWYKFKTKWRLTNGQ